MDDQGLAVDVALALRAADQQQDAVQAVADHLAANIKSYVSPGYGTLTSAGSTAKAAVLARQSARTPPSFGGVDLIARLERTVAPPGPPPAGWSISSIRSRRAPPTTPTRSRRRTPSRPSTPRAATRRDEATAYLLQQQCADGWFRLDLPAAAEAPPGLRRRPEEHSGRGCDGVRRTGTPRVPGPAGPGAAVDRAVAWLEDVQAPDGSFGGAPVGQDANSNSTGLAGWVLGDLGEAAAAEQAATWLAAHQVGDCPSARKPDVGAIAYDDAALSAAGAKGITVKTQDQFRRASAQAVPALRWLPAGASTEDRMLTWSSRVAHACSRPLSCWQRPRCCPVLPGLPGCPRPARPRHRPGATRGTGSWWSSTSASSGTPTCAAACRTGSGRDAADLLTAARGLADRRPAPAGLRVPDRRPAGRRPLRQHPADGRLLVALVGGRGSGRGRTRP